MSAYGTVLKDLGGNQILPKTKTSCVYDENGRTLDELLAQKVAASEIPAWAMQPSKPTYSSNEIQNFPTAFPANGGNADTVKNRDVCAEIDSLKQSAVDMKTNVANAINGKLGTALGVNSTGAELASYISQMDRKFELKDDYPTVANFPENQSASTIVVPDAQILMFEWSTRQKGSTLINASAHVPFIVAGIADGFIIRNFGADEKFESWCPGGYDEYRYKKSLVLIATEKTNISVFIGDAFGGGTVRQIK